MDLPNPFRRLWLSVILHVLFLTLILYLNQTPSRMFVGQQILAFELIEPAPPPPVRRPAPPTQVQPTPQLVEPSPRRRTLDEIMERLEKRKREYDRRQRRSDKMKDLRDRLKETAPELESYEIDTTRLAERWTELIPSTIRPTGQTRLEVGTFPFRWYLNILQQRVYHAWKQPSGLLVIQDFMKTVVHLRINRDGRISNISIRQSSQHSEMDRSAVMAVESLGQMPPLPDAFARNRLDVNIHFEVSR